MSKTLKQIYIWQLPMTNKRCFKPITYDTVDVRDYVAVYHLKEEIDDKKINEYLEELYGKLQIDEPKDYHARSMMISDLITYLDTETHEIVGYVVDLIGFKKVKVVGIS